MDNSDLHSEKVGKITLESLLRIKRNERPSDEFWSRFDRELEEKRLRALVAQRPQAGYLRRFAGFVWNPVVAMTAVAACVTLLAIANPFATPTTGSTVGGALAMDNGLVSVEDMQLRTAKPLSDFQRPDRTAFALDTMTLASKDSDVVPVSATERISTGYSNRIHFVSGSIGTLATGSVAVY